MRFFSVPLLLLLLACACDRRPLLTGETLLKAVNTYLHTEDSLPPRFKADPDSLAPALRTVLSHGISRRTGQDTLFITGSDGKKRALGLHIPVSYSPERPLPVVLWFHGGVNGFRQDRGAEVAHFFAKESDSCYFLFAALSGERGATWFDAVGIGNILSALRLLKLTYNIDDNRVILAGVSDGGTGCYLSGMTYPGPFAGYVVCSGNPEVLPSLGLPLLPANMRLRPWLIVHGGQDRLYPGERMLSMADLFRQAEIPMTFHYHLESGHDFQEYYAAERSALLAFFTTTRRPDVTNHVAFQALQPLRLNWLSIDSVEETACADQPAVISAFLTGDTVKVNTLHVAAFSLLPVPPFFHPGKNLQIILNEKPFASLRMKATSDAILSFARKDPDKSFLPFCCLAFQTRKK